MQNADLSAPKRDSFGILWEGKKQRVSTMATNDNNSVPPNNLLSADVYSTTYDRRTHTSGIDIYQIRNCQ